MSRTSWQQVEVSGFVDADVVDTRKSSVDLDRQVGFSRVDVSTPWVI